MSTHTADRRASAGLFGSDTPVGLLLRLIAVAGLAVNAYVHFDIAPVRGVIGDDITQEHLFYAQATGAAVVGVWLLVRGSRLAWLAAFAVAAGGLGLLLLYHYVNVGEIGPIPNMYDPVWYDDKRWTAYAETATVAAALVWAALEVRRRGS